MVIPVICSRSSSRRTRCSSADIVISCHSGRTRAGDRLETPVWWAFGGMLAGRRVRVQLCGRMCVQGDDGVRIDSSAFPGRQGRIVFAYLVSTPQPVPRDVLADLLWPGRLPDAWRRDLAAVVSKLRGLLARPGLDATGELRGGGNSYQLVLFPRSEIDADAVAARLAEAESASQRGDLASALQAAQAAAEVARRPFLPGEIGDWVAQRQNALDGV